jgi:hypothetical protein
MKKTIYSIVLAFACGVLLICAGSVFAADAPANVAGAWEVTSEGRNGPMTQTLTITQDGAAIKGTMKGQRGEAPVEGTVAGSKITFSVTRTNQDGDKMVMEYTGTVEADSIKGKVHSERFGDRDFTAKRTK